jgi:hypothetical protein
MRAERRAAHSGGCPGYFVLLAYHLLPVVALLSVYFNLRGILPIINSTTYDDFLYNMDLTVLGFEPTVWVERFSSRGVVEYFAFFYYSYFFFVSAFIFVTIFSSSNERRMAHFGTGIMLVVAIGHVIYTFVPGYGPYAFLAHEYQRPLAGGPFYNLVLEAVNGAGALRDIFPSLHTALPTFCTLFAWKHHRRVAPIATFFTVNIILATIVLRWHYAADICAGLVLGSTAFLLAPRLVELYQSRREALGLALRRW